MTLKDYPPQAGRVGYVIHSIPDDLDHYILIRDCMMCQKEARVTVPSQGLWDWEHGAFVQRAMPSLTSEEREIVITGTHPFCWDKAFPEEEE